MEAYGRFIVALLRVIALKRSRKPRTKRTPTYLIIDEFQNFISSDLEKALTQLRKYRLYLILASQYIWQRVDKYLQKALFSVGVIVAGQNERKSRKSIEEETGISVADTERLRNGEFWIKSGTRAPFKIRTPKYLLKNARSMASSAWRKLRAEQLKKYYFRPNEWKAFTPLKTDFDLNGLSPKFAI